MSALPTDFNDLAAAQGLAAVSEQLEPAIQGVADWAEPLLSAAEPPPIPADLLPGWLGRFAEAVSKSLQVPGAMVVGFALSTVAAAVQRRYETAPLGLVSDYREPAGFWSLTAADPGTRKTGAVDALTKPLLSWECCARALLRAEIAAHNARIDVTEALVARLRLQAGKSDDPHERDRLWQEIGQLEADKPDRRHAPRVFVSDVTVERLQNLLHEQGGRAAILSDESGLFSTIAGSYAGGGGSSLDALLVGHARGSIRVERAGRQAFVDRAAVTWGTMVQPNLMASAAGNSRFRDSGLMARFFYFMPGQVVGKRDVRRYQSVTADLRNEYQREMDALLGDPGQGPHLPARVLPLADDAREAWLDFSQWIEDRLGPDGELAPIADWASKLAGAAARVALLFELVSTGPDAEVVNLDSIQRAIEFCRLAIPHARTALRMLGADQVDHDAREVLSWVARGGHWGGFKQSELHLALRGRFTKRERLMAALQRLQSSHCLRHESKRNPGTRPTDYWHVNPRLNSH